MGRGAGVIVLWCAGINLSAHHNLVNNMKLFIGIPCSDFGRYNDFNDCLDNLIKPDNTIVKRWYGSSVAQNRNILIKLALQENCTHLLFLDDDMIFNSDLIVRLLAHEKDVVTGYCSIRYPPFKTVLIDGFDLGNNLIWHNLLPNEQGLIKIWASGLACALINLEVVKTFSEFTSIGFLHHDELSEDISFFMRLHKAGYDSYCDLDCHVGHHFNGVIWPDGKITLNNQLVGESNAILLRR